jgi:hypothetical protein
MSLAKSKELAAMLSASSLLHELGMWHERLEAQYSKADRSDNVGAAVATARAAVATIEAFAKIGPLSDLAARLTEVERRMAEGTTEEEETADERTAL